MRILPSWIREFFDVSVDDKQLAEDLTHAGIAVESMDGAGAATVYEMDITTNRVDAMNHYGIAREASAIYDRDLKALAPVLPKATPVKSPFPVEIQEPDLCARFTARVIRGVQIKTSQGKVAQRFAQLGQKLINNAADATNYVLLLLGQPTHAFDLDKLEGGKLIVRKARAGEKLKTLDGIERTLDTDDLVVADAVKAVGLAGVMGGWDTMITQQTKNVLVEAAWFDPASVRRSSRRHLLHTDASHRFERGADFQAPPVASALVAELILASGEGTLAGELVDAIARDRKRAPITFRRSEALRILGQDVPEKDVNRILTRLGFKPGSGSSNSVAAPSWRLDIEREIDLIEEIARVYGFNNFQNRLPAFSGGVVELSHAEKQERIRRTLLALGYHEAISSTFISAAEAARYGTRPAAPLENPLSEEASVMRTALLPGMLNMIAYNVNRGTENLQLYEIGNVFAANGNGAANSADKTAIVDSVSQNVSLAIGACGEAEPASVHGPGREYNFYDLKGDIERVLGAFEYESLQVGAQAAEYLHPGRSACIAVDGVPVGYFGQIHPDVAAEHKIKRPVFIAELDLEQLYNCALRSPRYRKISKFPAVDRDFSFVFANQVTWRKISSTVAELKIPEMQSFVPKEIFRGGAVPEGKYSILMHAVFQSAERTLRDDEVQVWSQQIIKALEALGGVLRAS